VMEIIHHAQDVWTVARVTMMMRRLLRIAPLAGILKRTMIVMVTVL
jgi:hypothetical protein